MPPIRVLIADDHPMFREGIARAVASWPEFDVIVECENGRDALEAIRRDAPDVALLDLQLPELDGIGVVTAVARDGLATRILILSAYDDEEMVYRAVEAGAAGYLTKDARRDEIARAILQASRGQTVLNPELANALASQIRVRSRGDAPVLTEREQQVLALLAEGKSAPEIGKQLFLATTTVKTHLSHLYEKLGVSDRAAAVAEGMRRGLLE
jgi:two-component system nitrate/nitrite response regulator NarL